MPLTPPFDFPHRVNDDLASARERAVAWGRRLGLEADARTWRRFHGADCAKMIAYAYPDATGPDLELAVDMMCFFFVVDELFDGPWRGETAHATAFVDELVGVLDLHTAAPRQALSPVAGAFADLWQDSVRGMSAQWRARAAAHWTRYFWGNVTEDVDRTHQPPTTVDAYLSARRDVIGYQPCQDMIERASGFEVPGHVWHQTAVRELSAISTDLVILCNDIYSLEKELDRGDSVNAVMLLARTTAATPEEALGEIVALTEEYAARFHTTAARARELAAHLHLDGDQRESLERWIDGNHTWVGAHNDWSCEITRYSAGADPVHPNDDFLRTLTRHH
ncbi:hypothetical protein [Streptomyces sp. NPDC096339]|uniref:terpene synthase family protein n=1 Tax=Streptomyces sp. NPDC096339 TaxID=3366086 RepID=UPI00380A9327